MTLGESEKAGVIFWVMVGWLVGNSSEIARVGQKSHKIHISLTDGCRNLVDPSKNHLTYEIG